MDEFYSDKIAYTVMSSPAVQHWELDDFEQQATDCQHFAHFDSDQPDYQEQIVTVDQHYKSIQQCLRTV